jgi:hypothetical protein
MMGGRRRGPIILYDILAAYARVIRRHASRRDNRIDEQPDSHLIGDVPRIHPELHVNRNTSEAK